MLQCVACRVEALHDIVCFQNLLLSMVVLSLPLWILCVGCIQKPWMFRRLPCLIQYLINNINTTFTWTIEILAAKKTRRMELACLWHFLVAFVLLFVSTRSTLLLKEKVTLARKVVNSVKSEIESYQDSGLRFINSPCIALAKTSPMKDGCLHRCLWTSSYWHPDFGGIHWLHSRCSESWWAGKRPWRGH